MGKQVLVTSNRRKQIKDATLSILTQANACQLPTDLKIILRTFGIKSMSTSKAYKAGIVDTGEMHAQTLSINGGYIIIYNDKQNLARVRWSIAHEIGHIALRHFARGIKDDIAEAEANYFAKEILMPIAVLDKYGCHTAEQIAKVCNVSLEAASYRLKDLARHNDYKAKYGFTWHDKMFLQQFNSMFNQEISAEICYFA